jgi:signal transduction histidine kinase
MRAMRFSFAKLSAFHRGFGVSAALFLATTALAGLSIQSVYREAQVRKRLIADTHRSIANLVTVRLDTAMSDADRTAVAEIQMIEPHAEALLKKFGELEGTRPWLEPLVLVSRMHTNTDQLPTGPVHFDELLATAERSEHQAHSPGQAAVFYAKAASLATTTYARTAAFNGQARSELKAGEPVRAAGTYKKLIAGAETLDHKQARLSLIAREQLVVCYQLLGDRGNLRAAVLDLYRFLIGHRFILDDDTYAFYRGAAEKPLSELQREFDDIQRKVVASLRTRERLLDSIAMPLRANAAVRMTQIGNSGTHMAHVWTVSSVRALLARSLADPGPWSGIAVALLEEAANSETAAIAPPVPDDAVSGIRPLAWAPSWRVAAFPQSGTVDALASRELIRFAAFLLLVFGTVVAAMVLAARSVARELSLSRIRSDFVASVSHELKTPLSLIRMFAESLREGWVGEDKRAGYYEVITRESERLTGLINNVLDFSRIESGTRKYQRARADLREVLAGLLDRYQYHLKAARIELVEELPTEPVYASVDREAMEQVLVNLLSNAVKYMGNAGQGPRRVRVSLATSGEHAVMEVKDTGIGIAEHDRLHIFDRFWRANDDRVRAVAGSGLGLTLVKHIVEAHDGTIAIESLPGRGSTFAVTLPLSAGERV